MKVGDGTGESLQTALQTLHGRIMRVARGGSTQQTLETNPGRDTKETTSKAKSLSIPQSYRIEAVVCLGRIAGSLS